MQDTRFKKGHPGYGKGKTVYDRCTPEGIEKMRRTMFSKDTHYTSKPIGTEVVAPDGFVLVKVQDHGKKYERWRQKHRIVWEQRNGPIPKGFIVQFKDGNRQNCAIENLQLISRADQMKTKNSSHVRIPQELQGLWRARTMLNNEINKQLKQEKHEQSEL